jgi:ribosomal protein L40E
MPTCRNCGKKTSSWSSPLGGNMCDDCFYAQNGLQAKATGDINFICPACGKNLVVDRAGIGMEVNCPNCNVRLTIPAATSALKEVVRPHLCPSCGAVLAPDAVVCIQCGYDFLIGKRLVAPTEPAREERGDKRASSSPAPWWLVTKKGQWMVSAILCIFLYLPKWHIITGSQGTKFIPKVSWSLNETFVNYDALMNMPYIAAKAQYPLTTLALERKGVIRSPEEPNTIDHSAAYNRGAREGRAYGEKDRDHNSYDNFIPDSEGQMRIAYGYQPGTSDYADFWTGYKDGYVQTRMSQP